MIDAKCEREEEQDDSSLYLQLHDIHMIKNHPLRRVSHRATTKDNNYEITVIMTNELHINPNGLISSPLHKRGTQDVPELAMQARSGRFYMKK